MDKQILPIALFLLIASLLTSHVTAAPLASLNLTDEELSWLESHPRIYIGTMDAWPPFNFVESNGKPTGIGSDIIAALNMRLDGRLRIVPGEWKELYDKVKERHLDAIMDITPKREREAFFNFTKPYLDVPHVIVAQRNTPYLENEDSLKGKVLALEKGFGNVNYFKQHYPEVTIREYRNTAYALDAVVRGEADAYAGNRGVAVYLINKELMTNLQIHGRLSKTGSILTLGTRKDWPILAGILQKGLDDISQEEYLGKL
ncbi:MAG: transporter substrate-binding domain-containing protein [Sedimenticola sp.]